METRPRILVVDDTPSHIKTLAEMLRQDYDLRVATEGLQALELAEAQPPDLVLLDIVMPGMDGMEVCRRLKANPATADVPVIFVTAKDDAEDEARGLELGAVDYIRKPFNIAIVRARVRTHLNLLQARRDLALQNEKLQEAARLREDVERIGRHDIKNPLTSMLSLPQLLLMADNLEDHQREMLHRIEESAYVMLRMINFSLDLFKMERGIYTVQPEDVDLSDVLRRVGNEFEGLVRSHRLSLEVLLDGEPAAGRPFMVRGEDLLCYSMCGNLVRNALEAAPPETTVTVRLTSGSQARLSVHNMGAVPPGMRERFFEKYATEGKDRGTGLGTYSARLTADTLGGTIGFETSEAEGTLITVTLPAA